jgi:DNA recombination protein RmuC
MTIFLALLAVCLVFVLIATLWFFTQRVPGTLQTLGNVQAELRGLAERIGGMEHRQGDASSNLMLATSTLRGELSNARAELTQLQTQARVRAETDMRVAESVRRLETVIAGTQSKGAAGENILDVVFSRLPIEWQIRDFTVGNKTVEFALRLPNNLVLPIDSKWPATDLLERFSACDDSAERLRLKGQIETIVLAKAREVRKYLDPARTVTFGIAAVPDAVYDLCTAVQCDCFEMDVVLVAYSMFIPYLLLVFQTVLRTSQNIDLEKLDAYLRTAEVSVKVVQQELEGRFARALTMLANSRDDMNVHLSKINSSLTSLHVTAQTADAVTSHDSPLVTGLDVEESVSRPPIRDA